MFRSKEDQHGCTPVPKRPSAIEDLISQKPISALTPDEYLTLVKEAQSALEKPRR
jgi:hypothetical protein